MHIKSNNKKFHKHSRLVFIIDFSDLAFEVCSDETKIVFMCVCMGSVMCSVRIFHVKTTSFMS